MSLVLNTNINSLTAQRNLATSQSSLSKAMARLSSGSRINSAADDAAGSAISSRMTTQISGLTQASRNANDGVSLAQTAEGALSELKSNLQRIRELAVQAANDSNSDSDRAALQAEVEQRLQEIDRSAATTTYNGRRLLDGTFGNATFQVGANAGESISIQLDTSMRTNDIGNVYAVDGGAVAFNADADGDGTDDSYNLTVQIEFTDADGNSLGTVDSEVDSADTDGDGTGDGFTSMEQVAEAINKNVSGVSAWVEDSDGDGVGDTLHTSSTSGYTIADSGTDDSGIATAGAAAVDLDGDGTDDSVAATTTGLYGLSVETASDANDTIVKIDAALAKVSDLEGQLGAMENRFDSAINSSDTTAENLTSARSRIQDADYAAETSNMTSANILQQAGVSVLSQANSSLQNILKLLQ